MIYPLKQYRLVLLIPAILCTLLLLFFTVIKASVPEAPKAPEEVSEQLFSAPVFLNAFSNRTFSQSVPAFPKGSLFGSATVTLHNERTEAATYQIQVYSKAGMAVHDQLGSIPVNGSVIIAAADMADAPSGEYWANVASDGPLGVVVAVEEPTSQSLGLYNGVGAIASTPVFGPLFAGSAQSTLVLANTFAATITTQLEFKDLSGTVVHTHSETIPPSAAAEVALASLSGLSTDFIGTATATSTDGNFAGVVRLIDQQGKITYQNELGQQNGTAQLQRQSATVGVYLPKLANQTAVGDEISTQTSSMFISTFEGGDTTLVASGYSYDAESQFDFTDLSSLSSNASLLRKISGESEIEVGTYSGVVSADRPILATQISSFDEPTSYGSDSYSVNSFSASASGENFQSVLWLPRVVKEANAFSVIAVQNVGASNSLLQIRFYNRSGAVMHTHTEPLLQPNLAKSVDLRSITELPSDFSGSAVIVSDQPIAGLVDEYHNFATSLTPDPVTLMVTGPERAVHNEPMQAVAAVTPSAGTPGSAVYPIGYTWALPQTVAAMLRSTSNGITSTGTITWGVAGIHVVEVTANTGIGQVTVPYTVAVSARSVEISSMQATSFTYSSFADGTRIQMLVPGQEISGTIRLDYLPTPSVSEPNEEGFRGQAFEFHVLQNELRVPNYTFEEPVTLTINYTSEDLRGGDEQLLTLRRWTETAWEDARAGCGDSLLIDRKPDDDELMVQLCQAGQFALFGAAATIYVPIIQ